MNREPSDAMPAIFKRFWPILLFALIPLIPLSRAILQGEAIGPFDQIRQMAPWNASKPGQPWDVLQADGVLQFYVWRDMVFEAWGKGQIPFWNHYQLAGTPLLGNSQSGGLYPLHIVLGVMHLSTASAMTLLAWFHLFWAGLGAYFLTRRLGGAKLGSTVAGTSFALSTFMIAWTGLPSVIQTVSWIPWILAFACVLVRPSSSKHASRMTPVCLAGCIAMMILAGHLQFVAYGLIALGLMSIWLVALNAINSDRDRPFLVRINGVGVAKLLLGLSIGFAIAAPQLLSVLNYSQFSHRRNSPTEQGYSAFVDSAIQPYELAKMLIPTIQGNPRQAVEGLPVSTYYPVFLKPGANFAESAIGLGIFVVLLVALIPLLAKRTDPIWAVACFGVFGFLIAMGTPLNRVFYFMVPGWSSTGSPGRAICLFVLAACVCAGLAASRLESLSDRPRRCLVPAGCVAGLLVIVIVLMNGYAAPKSLDPNVIRTLKEQAESTALSGSLGVILLAIAAVAFAILKRSEWAKAGLIALPVLSSVAFLGTSLVQTGDPNLKVPQQAGNQRIAPINSSWDIYTAQRATLPPNLSALNRIHSLDGYDSLLHRDTVAMLQDIDGRDAAPAANGNIMYVKPSADRAKLADAGVSEVWSSKPLNGFGEPSEDNGVLRYKIQGPGRASTPQGSAEITEESFDGMTVKAVGPGRLVVRERNMPGWSAKVGDRATQISGDRWIEMDLPAGTQEVHLKYVAPGFRNGILLAVLGFISVVVWILFGRIQQRKPNEKVAKMEIISEVS